MKTLKKGWVSWVLTCCLLAGALIAKGADRAENKISENVYEIEYFNNLDILEEEIENLLSEKDQVQIYDSSNQLIVEGTKNDENIIGYLGISDLLTEIDGIKYYRLSYK